ncbi:cryptochrome/photolyase family protein [Parvularcula dongshanensis]|uniref:Deoxyribodipyrimidine photo-lyase n=1 Tax=Parvularcula dongshanensis TaxID=1173995 RepID=A0A840I541_9PROT|nr:deoxyribodipyrimidine photo-lyase [Parvularcula dongshanensis]MBB4659140.1 deoxyribodipyrimidine photo-lyase [Parvularcula dongshanensis]
MPDTAPALVWLRNDLRLEDNPALRAAADSDRPAACLYVLDDVTPGDWAMGGAQRWWLHKSLEALAAELDRIGSALILRRGDSRGVVPSVAQEVGADLVTWNRRYIGWQKEVDDDVAHALQEQEIEVRTFRGTVLFEPGEIRTGSGNIYKVFGPYWRKLREREVPEKLAKVQKLDAPAKLPSSDHLGDWNLLPTQPNWAGAFEETWEPGERGGRARWLSWLKSNATSYDEDRNFPGRDASSRQSPHLHFGETSPVVAWHDLRERIEDGDVPEDQGESWLSELAWREFHHQLLCAHPEMFDKPLDAKFERFEWDTDDDAYRAWTKGQTGYPIVDAGMRQLWQTGWMHNRVRMITGSFFVKDLLLDWRRGMAWFWDCLVDADPANNTAQWQWIAGCGADASPFFRVFNPVGQGERFDPEGAYVKRWCPELKDLPKKHVHAPWDALADVLKKAGVVLGKDYPEPIVEHAARRDEALARYKAIKT